MNPYLDDAERGYAVRTLAAGPMRVQDALNFMQGRRVYLLATVRGLSTSGLTKPQMAQQLIADTVARGEDVPVPEDQRPAPPPVIDEPQPIDPDADKCICPDELNDSRAMLRWHKADKGEAITVSYDMANAPAIEGLNEQVIDSLFGQIARVCGITFAKKTEKKGDIHISFVDLSKRKTVGGAQILGFAYQPASGDKMSAAGDLAGDIFCDNSRQWLLWEMLIKLLHEIAHACGLHHTNIPADIMYSRPTAAGQRSFSAGDIKQWVDRYGPAKVAA